MNVQNTEWFYPPKTEIHKCAGWFVRVEVLRYVVCGLCGIDYFLSSASTFPVTRVMWGRLMAAVRKICCEKSARVSYTLDRRVSTHGQVVV